MEMAVCFQILDKDVYISFRPNTVGKGMNPTILHAAVSKIVGQTELFSLVWQPV